MTTDLIAGLGIEEKGKLNIDVYTPSELLQNFHTEV